MNENRKNEILRNITEQLFDVLEDTRPKEISFIQACSILKVTEKELIEIWGHKW